MASTTLAPPSTVDVLMNAYRSHVAGTGLPEPCSIQLDTFEPRINIQTGGRLGRFQQLTELLIWAQTLDAVTAEWWHTPSEQLHVTVLGRSPTGVQFKVFSGVHYQEVDGLVRLQPNERESVSIDELHLLVGLLREDAA